MRRPDLGFVWLAYCENEPVAVCVVSFAVSTSMGTLVAKLDDVYVAQTHRRRGVGATHFASLVSELKSLHVGRVDTSVHTANVAARNFYARLGSNRCMKSGWRCCSCRTPRDECSGAGKWMTATTTHDSSSAH